MRACNLLGLLLLFSRQSQSSASLTNLACYPLPETVRNQARCRALCTVAFRAQQQQCVENCLETIPPPANSDATDSVNGAAPWPSVSFDRPMLTVGWNSSGFGWKYYAVVTSSPSCPAAANTTHLIENSPLLLDLEPVVSGCVYTVCLTGVDENGTSNASGPIQVATQFAATGAIVKPYFEHGHLLRMLIEWTCPNSTCVFNWTTEYRVRVSLQRASERSWCNPDTPTDYHGRVSSSTGTSVILTEENEIKNECTYVIEITADNRYRIVPVISLTYQIPSAVCIHNGDPSSSSCPPHYVPLTTPHPETLNLGPVSDLQTISMGRNSDGWVEIFLSWGLPNSSYHHVVSVFIIYYYQVVKYPDGWRFEGTHTDTKELSLFSNKQYDETDTFNITLELVSNKYYAIGVYCETVHNKQCFDLRHVVSTFSPTDNTTTTERANVRTFSPTDSTTGTGRANVRDGNGLVTALASAVPLFVVLVAIVLLVWWYWYCLRQRRKKLSVSRSSATLVQDMTTTAADTSSLLIPKDLWELERQRIVLEADMGQGNFGSVSVAVLAPGLVAGGKRRERAFKRVAVKTVKETSADTDRVVFQQEIDIMKAIGSHRHVVEMLGCCTDDSPLYLVLELVPFGNLLELLRRSREQVTGGESEEEEMPVFPLRGGCLERSQIFNVGRQIAAGMEHVSSLRIVHRDLAARNILVGKNMTLKVADFGLSRDVYLDSAYQNTTRGRLPIKWMALESLMYRTFTSLSDVWSYGVLLWETVTLGAFPYPAISAQDLPRMLSQGYRMDCPVDCSQDIYNIMLRCWSNQPSDRPTFHELLKDMEKLMQLEPETFYVTLDDRTDWLPTDDCTPDIELDLESQLSEGGGDI